MNYNEPSGLIKFQKIVKLDMTLFQILKNEGVLGMCSSSQKKIKKISIVYDNLITLVA